MWCNPTPYTLVPTEDSQSFKHMERMHTGLPIGNHPGAFGVQRKHHIHEGVDLYVPRGTPITTVEAGMVVAIIPFTGPRANMPWWNDTWAVLVEGESGVVAYGEIASHTSIGSVLSPGSLVGVVMPVLKHDKGRPMSMLHLELHKHGTLTAPPWYDARPTTLLDPTNKLLSIMN